MSQLGGGDLHRRGPADQSAHVLNLMQVVPPDIALALAGLVADRAEERLRAQTGVEPPIECVVRVLRRVGLRVHPEPTSGGTKMRLAGVVGGPQTDGLALDASALERRQ